MNARTKWPWVVAALLWVGLPSPARASVWDLRRPICIDDIVNVRLPPIEAGCEMIDCCPGCPGSFNLDWRVNVAGEAVDGVILRFESLSNKARASLKLKGDARWLDKTQLRIGRGETVLSGLSVQARARPTVAVARIVMDERAVARLSTAPTAAPMAAKAVDEPRPLTLLPDAPRDRRRESALQRRAKPVDPGAVQIVVTQLRGDVVVNQFRFAPRIRLCGRPPVLPASTARTVLFDGSPSGSAQIYTVRDDATNLQQLTAGPGDAFSPCWASAGTKVVFGSDRTGDEEIFVMDANGANETNLTNNPMERDWFPVVSPDSTRVAYWKERSAGGPPNLYVMKMDGTGKTRLSSANSSLYPEPHVFSRSGTMLAYADNHLTSGFHPKLRVVSVDGTNDHALTGDQADELRPLFTCDDQKVVFTSMRDGNWEIYSAAVAGGGLVNLSNNRGFDFAQALSPDCSRILFESDRAGSRDIYTMRLDGSDVRRLTLNAGDDVAAFYSTDGSLIGFISRPGTTNGGYDLWVMNADGSNLHKVSGPASGGANCCPLYEFSKDGKRIVFGGSPPNAADLFAVDPDGSHLTNLTSHPSFYGSGDFQH